LLPLHNHTDRSALDGLATPAEIARRCLEIDAEACGITDHGVVSGHLDFDKALRKEGLKPIFGCELYHGTAHTFKGQVRDQAHVIALAKTDEGLRNLWCLSNTTASEDHFRYVGRVFWEDLEKYKDGLIVTSACALGLVAKGIINDDLDPINRFLDIFGDHFFIEIHTYPEDKSFAEDVDGNSIVNQRLINEALVEIAQERGIPMVYANDAHYAFPSQAKLHDMFLARQTGQSIFTPVEERKMWHPPGALSIMDEQHVRDALWYLPESVVDEAISNSDLIAETVDAKLPDVTRHLPVFVPRDCPWMADMERAVREKEGTLDNPEVFFIDLVEEGIVMRYGKEAPPEVWERAAREVEVLIEDGIHHYFLMGWDECMAADKAGILRGPGRGSSAGCIVAYALGITDVDPLHYELIFERFWNKGRTDGFPDIDTDFSRTGRPKIIEYLKDRWGLENVVAIGTVGHLKPKVTVDKLAGACGISRADAAELKAILDTVPDLEIHGVEQIGWTRELEPGKVIYVKDAVGDEIDKWVGTDDIRANFISMCEQTCSRVSQYGIHASGIAISDVPTAGELPAYLRGGKDERRPATQFPMDEVDKRGFVKLDVLGLRTLDTLAHWQEMMAEEGIEIDWSGLDLQDHPDEMWDLLQEGYAAGIFQVEAGFPKRLCEQMNARSVDDLAIIVALNRPGPMENVPQYLRRRLGEEPVTYADPRLEEILDPILAPTYGIFVYQEQVISFFNALDYTLGESDAVRKILGKKKPEALAALKAGTGEWKGRGYDAMAKAAGLSENVAGEVWRGLERFASYSFNKSHAVAYGILGFRCLFAKYYGPAQFYAACVRTVDGEKRKEMLPLWVNEARRLGLEIYPPDIEISQGLAAVTGDGDILLGFGDVKGVGNSGDYMAQLRDRCDHDTPQRFYAEFEEMQAVYEANKKARTKRLAAGEDPGELPAKSPKQMLGANKIEAIFRAGAWDNLVPPDIPIAERQDLEEELLGVILTDFTKEAFEANAQEVSSCDDWGGLRDPFAMKIHAYSEVQQEEVDMEDFGFRYQVPGIVTGVQEKIGKKSGKKFGIVTIEYESDELEFIVFNRQWVSHRFLWRIRTPGIFVLKHTQPSQYGESYQFIKGHVLKP
jgi:DNA polymerase-3 subunit alpha